MARRERVIAAGADLVDGGPGVRFTIGEGEHAMPAFAIRYRGRVHAYVNACAHQDIELDWVPGAFYTEDARYVICALHGALYEPDSGHCVAGPCAGAKLVKLAVRERPEDGAIVLEDV